MDTLQTFSIKPIKTEQQYNAAMEQIRKLWDCPPNTSEADLLEVLSILVEDFESKHYPVEPLDPIEAIRYRMEEQGLSQRDLIKYFGSKERVSEVLNRKRPLTLRMIKSLYHGLGISADSLLST
ncbi:MAG: transcriptional regulator [Spirosomataceae bacterium]